MAQQLQGALRGSTLGLVLLNLALHLVVLCLAGWTLNTSVNPNAAPVSGTDSTTYLTLFALIASAVGTGSMFSGLHHAHSWTLESYAASSSVAVVALLLGLEALGFASKGINSKAFRCSQVKALEGLVIVVVGTQLIYIIIIRIGKSIGAYA